MMHNHYTYPALMSSPFVCSKIINKSERNLKKGSGYHLDLFLVGVLVGMGGLFGLPVMTGAAVRSVSHVSALSVYSHQQAPGMKPVLSLVREQRVTAFAVHIMIGGFNYANFSVFSSLSRACQIIWSRRYD